MPTRHSLELIAKGRELAGKLGGRPRKPQVSPEAASAIADQADQIVAAIADGLSPMQPVKTRLRAVELVPFHAYAKAGLQVRLAAMAYNLRRTLTLLRTATA